MSVAHKLFCPTESEIMNDYDTDTQAAEGEARLTPTELYTMSQKKTHID